MKSLFRPENILLALAVALAVLALPAGCVPDAQAEAEAVAADVQDAKTAAMQAAIDQACAGLRGHAEMQCALDTLEQLQPHRWIPEDAARAALAAPFAAEYNNPDEE